MNTKRNALTLLCLAALIGSTACGSQTATSTEQKDNRDNVGAVTGAEVQAEVTEAVTEAPAIPGGELLPDTDMGGEEFHVLSMAWYEYDPLNMDDIVADDENGEPLNDAVYRRQHTLEERFNCKLVQDDFQNEPGIKALEKSVNAGDDSYQIALLRSCYFARCLTGQYLTSLDAVPNLHLEEAWYDIQSQEALGILNTNYGIVSDITMNSYLLIFSVYFNQNMMDSYDLGNMYEIVDSGNWTWDTLYTMGRAVAADLDNDGKATAEDRYGFTYVSDIPEGLLNAAGVRYATMDSDGVPQVSYQTEDAISKMQELLSILEDTSTSFGMNRSDNQSRDEVGFFINRKTLFAIAGIYYAEQFRGMEDNFGIIPMPKYDVAQESYASPLFCNVFPITVVPTTNQNLENTGIILDALSYEGHYTLLPAFYDTILQGKVTRDEDSNRMLDMIFENTFYDSGNLFDFGGVKTKIRQIYSNLKGDFSSTFAKIEKSVTKDIQKLTDSVQEG